MAGHRWNGPGLDNTYTGGAVMAHTMRRLTAHAALPLILLALAPVGDATPAPAVCSTPCDEPTDAKIEAPSIAEPAYDAAVDEDVFNVHTIAADLCVAAQEQVAAGISENDMVDAAVEVFTVDAPLVTTEAGVWYLRGVLRGCVA